MLFIILNTRSVFAFLSQGLDYIDFACLKKYLFFGQIWGLDSILKRAFNLSFVVGYKWISRLFNKEFESICQSNM